MTPPPAERGFALLTAIIGMAMFALLALALLDTARGTAAAARAGIVQAQLGAAADAALVIAAANLGSDDQARRWGIDGRPREIRFAGTDLVIRVEDDRGKVPLNQITDEQARVLFEQIGADGATLDAMVDSFLDWRDDDDEVRDHGAETAYYRALGFRPRNGPLHSLDELGAVRGFDAAVVARLRSFVAVYRDQRDGFDPRYAQPAALTVMSASIAGAEAVQRQRELTGQVVAIDLGERQSLTGRPLTIRVVASRPDGGVLRRATQIVLTGARTRPYVVRQRS